jgi:hypothetical protein
MPRPTVILELLDCRAQTEPGFPRFTTRGRIRGMSDRKRLGNRVLATIVALAAVAYSLSFGPACWIVARADLRLRADLVNLPYRPVIWVYSRSSGPIEAAIRWYATAGCGTGSDWGFYPVDWDGPFEGKYAEFQWGHDAR